MWQHLATLHIVESPPLFHSFKPIRRESIGKSRPLLYRYSKSEMTIESEL